MEWDLEKLEGQTIQRDALQLVNVWYSCRAQLNLPETHPEMTLLGYVSFFQKALGADP